MIIKLSVENFLSFSSKQHFSCEATVDSSLRTTHVIEIGGKSVDGIVKSVALLGENGSGKTNLLKTFSYLQHIVTTGIIYGGSEDYSPAYHHSAEHNTSINIELVVLLDGVKYHYGVCISYHGMIEREFFTAYLTNRPQKWFDRHISLNAENEFIGYEYEYEPCVKFRGDKSAWEKATDGTELFMAKASKLGSRQLSPFYDWLCNKLVFLDDTLLQKTATKLFTKGPYKGINELCRFLNLPSSNSDENLISIFRDFTSNRNGRSIPFLYEVESDTTVALWDFALVLLDVLKHGKVLVADNFLDKLHPLTVRKVLDLFHNSAINTKGAQLLFTTHMVSLLDQKLLRRDQIWFVEKTLETDQFYGSSQLHRLTEFSPRKSDNIERNYLAGEYGALPKSGDISMLITALESA